MSMTTLDTTDRPGDDATPEHPLGTSRSSAVAAIVGTTGTGRDRR